MIESGRSSVSSALTGVWWCRLALLAVTVPWVVMMRTSTDDALSGVVGWGLTLFLLVNRVMSECVCRLVPLIESDLIDENMFVNKRVRILCAASVVACACRWNAGFLGWCVHVRPRMCLCGMLRTLRTKR